jgi:hypothetical protein
MADCLHRARSLLSVAITLAVAALACGPSEGVSSAAAADPAPPPAEPAPPPDATEDERRRYDAMLDRDWPKHGLVTGLQLVVRERPDPESRAIGWLRVGSRIRLRTGATPTPTCSTGWVAIHPHGHACAGQGITVGDAPPDGDFVLPPPARESPLPYEYWFVKEDAVPEYHNPPSRDDQRAAVAFSERLVALRTEDESGRRAARLLAGELANEPRSPTGVNRYLDRGFFVAGAGVEVRSSRRFVRTVRGRFVKQAQLEARAGSDFHGVALGDSEGERTLPVAWTVRPIVPLVRHDRADGTSRFVDEEGAAPIERHTALDGWLRRQNVGGDVFHVLRGPAEGDERFVRAWFVAVAERIDRPREIGADEAWAHVDLSEQTLVVYRGDAPVYASLVSTGLPGHDTPAGVFRIHSKYVADAMAGVGDERDERYSIDDVPWTQYFSGSLALHGAFWHGSFGLRRSHGCVNLAPIDAHRVFELLGLAVPDGWLGVSAEPHSPFRGSHVVITQ